MRVGDDLQFVPIAPVLRWEGATKVDVSPASPSLPLIQSACNYAKMRQRGGLSVTFLGETPPSSCDLPETIQWFERDPNRGVQTDTVRKCLTGIGLRIAFFPPMAATAGADDQANCYRWESSAQITVLMLLEVSRRPASGPEDTTAIWSKVDGSHFSVLTSDGYSCRGTSIRLPTDRTLTLLVVATLAIGTEGKTDLHLGLNVSPNPLSPIVPDCVVPATLPTQ